jgi:hypothetical protein
MIRLGRSTFSLPSLEQPIPSPQIISSSKEHRKTGSAQAGKLLPINTRAEQAPMRTGSTTDFSETVLTNSAHMRAIRGNDLKIVRQHMSSLQF